jgi:release factor glutamine methyltransferase
LSPTEIFAHPERSLAEEQRSAVEALLHRMLAREPLTRIVGVREFWGVEFLLSADTLDPRPETETVVEAVLAKLPDRAGPYRLLDLGTGTGCLLLALLSELPEANGIGVDVAVGAAATACRNAATLGFAGRASFAVCNWADAIGGTFDVIVANPPYITTDTIPTLSPEVRDHDPVRALDGGADGRAAYRAIAADLPRLLVRNGIFVAEIGAGQGDAVSQILSGAGLRVEELRADLAGITRCVVARAGNGG